MPEHEMPFAGNDDCDAFSDLPEFTQGYIHAIFFTECHGDNPELEHATFADLAPETLAKCKEDCAAFLADRTAWDALQVAYLETSGSYDDERAGTDFWFTRNHHGAGYWDRGLGAAGDALTQAAHGYSLIDLYRGDDGKVYLS